MADPWLSEEGFHCDSIENPMVGTAFMGLCGFVRSFLGVSITACCFHSLRLRPVSFCLGFDSLVVGFHPLGIGFLSETLRILLEVEM